MFDGIRYPVRCAFVPRDVSPLLINRVEQNILWPEDIQCPVVVSLAGLDKISPVKPIRRMLLSYPGFTSQWSPSVPSELQATSSRSFRNRQLAGRTQGGNEAPVSGGVELATASAQSPSRRPKGSDNMGEDMATRKKLCEERTPVKRVELIYWPDLAHGHQIVHRRTLEDLTQKIEQQAEVYGLGSNTLE